VRTTAESGADTTVAGAGFSYFMVRLRRSEGATGMRLCGVVERLGTSEKQSFEDAGELVRFLSGWRTEAAARRAGE
jgi:hypothetical protein